MAQNLNKGKQERDNGREKGRLPDGKGRPSGAKIDRPKKPPVSYREEPKPKPYNTNLEGNIKFDKEIYSKQNFNNLVDSSFGEVTPREDSFDTSQFFKQYERLFFDIPKDGSESHQSLVEDSLNYIGEFNNFHDIEIERLNSIILDLEAKLADKGIEDNTSVREHPFFKNGSLIFAEEGADWPRVFYMDKGFKRPVNGGDNDFWQLLAKLTDTVNPDNRVVVPSSILRSIPSGDVLNSENFGEDFEPNIERAEAQQTVNDFVVNLDARDAALSPEKAYSVYHGDFNEYKIALEQDYTEKTNAIDGINNKLIELNNASVKDDALIKAFNKELQSIISRRETVTYILSNFNDVITEAVIIGVLPNVASEVDLDSEGFDIFYDLELVAQRLSTNYGFLGGINASILLTVVSAISNLSVVNEIRNEIPELTGTNLYHALWVHYLEKASISDNIKVAILQTLSQIYQELQ